MTPLQRKKLVLFFLFVFFSLLVLILNKYFDSGISIYVTSLILVFTMGCLLIYFLFSPEKYDFLVYFTLLNLVLLTVFILSVDVLIQLNPDFVTRFKALEVWIRFVMILVLVVFIVLWGFLYYMIYIQLQPFFEAQQIPHVHLEEAEANMEQPMDSEEEN